MKKLLFLVFIFVVIGATPVWAQTETTGSSSETVATPEQAIRDSLLKPDQIPYRVVTQKTTFAVADTTKPKEKPVRVPKGIYPIVKLGLGWIQIQQGWIANSPKTATLQVDQQRLSELVASAKKAREDELARLKEQEKERLKQRNELIRIVLALGGGLLLLIVGIILAVKS